MTGSTILTHCTFLVLAGYLLPPLSSTAQQDDEDSGKVFSQLADYTDNRDRVLKEYCFLAQMETITIRGKNRPIHHQWYYLRNGRNKPYFQYRAFSRMPVGNESLTGEQS